VLFVGRVLAIWRSWSVRRRLAACGGAVAIVAAGAVIAYATLKRPGDVTNPSAPFHARQKPKAPRETDWPIYGYDGQRTRYLPAPHVHPPFSKPVWTWDAGRLLEFSPILIGHTLYDMDKAAILYAIDARNGKVRWHTKLGSLNASAPAYWRGRLFASTLEPGEIVSVRAKDGKVLWRHPLPGRTETSPLVYHGKVLAGCECGDIFALDAKTGKTVWSVPSAGPVKGGVALHDGTAFVGNYAGQLFAIDADSGHVEWEASSQGLSFGRTGSFYSTPAVAYGRVYAGNLDGRVYSFVAKTGQLAWSHSTGAEVYPGPAVADVPGTKPTVYIGSADHHFYALDARTGAVRWERNVGGIILGAASVIDRTVYVGVIGDNIGTFGFDAKTGKKVFYSPYGEYNPVISDSRDLYLTGSSKLMELRPVKRLAASRRGHGGQHQGPKQRHGGGRRKR